MIFLLLKQQQLKNSQVQSINPINNNSNSQLNQLNKIKNMKSHYSSNLNAAYSTNSGNPTVNTNSNITGNYNFSSSNYNSNNINIQKESHTSNFYSTVGHGLENKFKNKK